MGQEPGTNEEIQSFCSKNYGVTFPMFDKISVKGEDMHPLYQYLTSITQTPVSWNFQKFLISKEGKVVKSFSPRTSILDKEVLAEIEALSK
jgi:glutathione peroxidase